MKRRYKVIHLTEDMGVGEEKIIAALAGGIDRRRFEAEVWCLVRGRAMADAVRRSGIRVRILGLTGYHNPLNVLRLAWHLRGAGVDRPHFAAARGHLRALGGHLGRQTLGCGARAYHRARPASASYLGAAAADPFVRSIVCIALGEGFRDRRHRPSR